MTQTPIDSEIKKEPIIGSFFICSIPSSSTLTKVLELIFKIISCAHSAYREQLPLTLRFQSL